MNDKKLFWVYCAASRRRGSMSNPAYAHQQRDVAHIHTHVPGTLVSDILGAFY